MHYLCACTRKKMSALGSLTVRVFISCCCNTNGCYYCCYCSIFFMHTILHFLISLENTLHAYRNNAFDLLTISLSTHICETCHTAKPIYTRDTTRATTTTTIATVTHRQWIPISLWIFNRSFVFLLFSSLLDTELPIHEDITKIY